MYKTLIATTALVAVCGNAALALGLDRSNQDISIIFEDGGFAELSFGSVRPSLSGIDNTTPVPEDVADPTGDVGNDFTTTAFGVKVDVAPQFSVALIYDQPFGADVTYDYAPGANFLGGTHAELTSNALNLVGRYELNDNFSFHAGFRRVQAEADVTLSGLAFGENSGYSVALRNGEGNGWLAGVAYERPDIALRVALTYNSAVDIEFDTRENVAPDFAGRTTVTAPEAWNLDFQTGIAADTLLFGSIRHAKYSQTTLIPPMYGMNPDATSITNIDDGTAYSLGVGRRFSEAFAAQISVGYEPGFENAIVSPLSPTDGQWSVSLGGSYTIDNVILSGGLRYVTFGDAQPGSGDFPLGAFTDNSAVALGLSVGYRF